MLKSVLWEFTQITQYTAPTWWRRPRLYAHQIRLEISASSSFGIIKLSKLPLKIVLRGLLLPNLKAGSHLVIPRRAESTQTLQVRCCSPCSLPLSTTSVACWGAPRLGSNPSLLRDVYFRMKPPPLSTRPWQHTERERASKLDQDYSNRKQHFLNLSTV